MSKNEFLDILHEQLSGQLPEGAVAAHIQYYRNYIEEQQQKGRSESEVLNELGDPRLIARTLLDTETIDSDISQNNSYSENGSSYRSSASGSVKKRTYKLDLTTWYGKLIAILAAALIIFLLCTILSVLIPIILVVGAVLYLISYFRKKR